MIYIYNMIYIYILLTNSSLNSPIGQRPVAPGHP